MVPPSYGGGSRAAFEERLGDVLDHLLLDLVLLMALARGDEIEHVRVLEHLLSELTLRVGQRTGEVRHLAGELLSLVEMQVELMVEHRA